MIIFSLSLSSLCMSHSNWRVNTLWKRKHETNTIQIQDQIRDVEQNFAHAQKQFGRIYEKSKKIFLMENLLTSWFNQIKCTSHNSAKGGQCGATPSTHKKTHQIHSHMISGEGSVLQWDWKEEKEVYVEWIVALWNQIKLKSSQFS